MKISNLLAASLMLSLSAAVVVTQIRNSNPRPQDNSSKTASPQPRNDNRQGRGNDNERLNSGSTSGPPPTETSDYRTPSNPEIQRELAELKEKVAGIEIRGYVSEADLGAFYWLPNPVVLGFISLLVLLALFLHLLHLFRTRGLGHEIDQLAMGQRNLASRGLAQSGKSPAFEALSQQLNQQGEKLAQALQRINEVEGRFTAYHGQFRETVRAVGLTANWIGETQLRDAFAKDGGGISESDRASTIAVLERYAEPLRLNAMRTEPVSQALADVVDRVESRGTLAPELLGRIQSLAEGLGRFDQWHKDVVDQLTSLKRGSFSQRSSQLRADQERLLAQVDSGASSITQMVQHSRALLRHYFPENPIQQRFDGVPLPERESDLKKIVVEAPDYLMDWYNTLFQLQSQLDQIQRTPLEAEVVASLANVQQVAREALGKFDIQPEAIQIGQTSYDRRLHDAAVVRQAAQYPINTVIEVYKCGFRRMSNGEVLRRPQVVVAGDAAI